jgi:hypothetical protein
MTPFVSILATGEGRGAVAEWRRFFVGLLAGCASLILLTAAFEALAWQIGETWSMSSIAKWQSEGPNRAWRGGDGRSYLRYKLARALLIKPDVLVLGSSRANTFHGDLLRPYKFYNAGLTTWTLEQDQRFLELLTASGYKPKVIIINFDYWMFANGYNGKWADRFYEKPNTHIEDLKLVIDHLWTTPQILSDLPYTWQFKGIYAVLNRGDQSFHADGSLTSQPVSNDPRRLEAAGKRVGAAEVEAGDVMDSQQIESFQRLMAFARQKQIAIIGIQVPYYRDLLEDLYTNQRSGIWREFESPERHKFFEESGIIFFDFPNIPRYSEPQYFVDPLHPDTRVLEYIMSQVIADPRVRALLPRLVRRRTGIF